MGFGSKKMYPTDNEIWEKKNNLRNITDKCDKQEKRKWELFGILEADTIK